MDVTSFFQIDRLRVLNYNSVNRFRLNFTLHLFLDCKTVGFFSKTVKKSVKSDARARLTVSLSLFSLVPDLLFDCSRVLEYAKIWTVLQSNPFSFPQYCVC